MLLKRKKEGISGGKGNKGKKSFWIRNPKFGTMLWQKGAFRYQKKGSKNSRGKKMKRSPPKRDAKFWRAVESTVGGGKGGGVRGKKNQEERRWGGGPHKNMTTG